MIDTTKQQLYGRMQRGLLDEGMTPRQATAYRLHGTPATDARFHAQLTIPGAAVTLRCYTVLAIVHIGDVPHWRAAVTPCHVAVAGGQEQWTPIATSFVRHDVAVACSDVAELLLRGVGEAVTVETKLAAFVATKRLTSMERTDLPMRTGPAIAIQPAVTGAV